MLFWFACIILLIHSSLSTHPVSGVIHKLFSVGWAILAAICLLLLPLFKIGLDPISHYSSLPPCFAPSCFFSLYKTEGGFAYFRLKCSRHHCCDAPNFCSFCTISSFCPGIHFIRFSFCLVVSCCLQLSFHPVGFWFSSWAPWFSSVVLAPWWWAWHSGWWPTGCAHAVPFICVPSLLPQPQGTCCILLQQHCWYFLEFDPLHCCIICRQYMPLQRTSSSLSTFWCYHWVLSTWSLFLWRPNASYIWSTTWIMMSLSNMATFHFANCFLAFSICLKYAKRTWGYSHAIKTSPLSWSLSLFVTLLIFVQR